jgi:DNA-binding NtrC family response regulator
VDLQSLKQRFGILGNSQALNLALDTAMQVAPTDLTVLITGESGVGKEIFSQIIHQLSPRKHNPFIAVNCGAIPEGTIDSELFGHEKGSFTGASDARKGYFETVNNGTIFLDEVGELPHGTQARLLRVLETKEFIRVGSSKTQRTDVRVIAATNVDLMEYIRQGKFREDLYYRLSTVPIKVPALRERPEDIPMLFRKFCLDFADRYKSDAIQLDESSRQMLMEYPWYGNVRELKNVAEQVSVLAKNKILTSEELQRFIPAVHTNMLPAVITDESRQTGVSEREILYKVLFDMRNDITELKKAVYGIMPSDSGNQNSSVALQSYNEERNTPVILDTKKQEIPVEEAMSLVDMEKQMITKALRKYKGRRRDAANELGISERTLYRKIKEYKIPD